MRTLRLARSEHGSRVWKDLFGSGIELARNGFAICGRMAAAIDSTKINLARDSEVAA